LEGAENPGGEEQDPKREERFQKEDGAGKSVSCFLKFPGPTVQRVITKVGRVMGWGGDLIRPRTIAGPVGSGGGRELEMKDN